MVRKRGEERRWRKAGPSTSAVTFGTTRTANGLPRAAISISVSAVFFSTCYTLARDERDPKTGRSRAWWFSDRQKRAAQRRDVVYYTGAALCVTVTAEALRDVAC